MRFAFACAVLGLGLAAGTMGLEAPAFAQDAQRVRDGDRPRDDAARDRNRPRPTVGAPAPLIAGGIPGVLALGGAYLVVRRRRRKL